MQQLLIIIHILISLGIIGLVLIQHGKGADMGAGFGSGASQTMFGSAGSTPFLVKITGILAAAFFVNCLLLTYVVTQNVKQPAATSLTAPAQVVQPAETSESSTVPVSEAKKAPKTP